MSRITITIATPATDEEAAAALTSKHIKVHQLWRLHSMMLGTTQYEPLLDASGHPRVCHAPQCKNVALGTARKQLCPAHYPHFLERSNRTRALPRCIRCNANTRHEFEGQPTCNTCSDATTEYRREQADAQDADQIKRRSLDEAETVHDLREWMKEYLL
jgi:hypothetical protein